MTPRFYTPKILVEIWHKNGDVTKKKCPVKENTVIIQKGSRGRGAKQWEAELEEDCVGSEIRGFWIFRKIVRKVIIRSDSDRFVKLRKDIIVPTWDKAQARRFLGAGIASKLGDVRIKHEFGLVFWLIVALGAGNLILTIMQMRGVYFG